MDPRRPPQVRRLLRVLPNFNQGRLDVILLSDLVEFGLDVRVLGGRAAEAFLVEAELLHALVADHYLGVLSLEVLHFYHMQIWHLRHFRGNVHRGPAGQGVLPRWMLHV